MTRPATLKDVAEAAGVATTTVARVVNKTGFVSEETRASVLKAVEKTGYRVNSLAQSLKRNRSFVIGHLLRSVIPNPFYLQVARGVEEVAHARGYTVLTLNVQGEAEAERRGIETFLNWRSDALIFTTPIDEKNVEYAVKCRVPVVQVERPRSPIGHHITVRNYAGALAAMQHLIDLGHRHIAYVGAAPGQQRNDLADYVERERFGAYEDALRAIGSYRGDLVLFGEPYSIGSATAQGHGYDATRQLLARADVPTAILTSNDILAAGALQAIHEAGLRVPDDLSVIGFDDTLAAYLSPLLTSVSLPARRLGMAAAELVIDGLEDATLPKQQHLQFDAELILRRSTAVPR